MPQQQIIARPYMGVSNGIFWVDDPAWAAQHRSQEVTRVAGMDPATRALVYQPYWSIYPVPSQDLFDTDHRSMVGAWGHPLLALPSVMWVKVAGEPAYGWAWRVLLNCLGTGLIALTDKPMGWGVIDGFQPTQEIAGTAADYWRICETGLRPKKDCPWLAVARKEALDRVGAPSYMGMMDMPPDREGHVTRLLAYNPEHARVDSEALAGAAYQTTVVMSALNGQRLIQSQSGDDKTAGRQILATLYHDCPEFRPAGEDVVGWVKANVGATREYLQTLQRNRVDPSAAKGLALLSQFVPEGGNA